MTLLYHAQATERSIGDVWKSHLAIQPELKGYMVSVWLFQSQRVHILKLPGWLPDC